MNATAQRSLGELSGPFPDLVIACGGERLVDRVEEDSRRVGPGTLFVAVPGTRTDGHDFLRPALAAGCRALLVERRCVDRARGAIAAAGVTDVALLTAENTRGYPARLARELAARPDTRLVVAGVTGTNGKTTTACLLQELLGRVVGRCGLLGTIRYDDGETVRPAPLTTPSGPRLFPWLRELVAAEGRAVALEVSSHALAQERVAGLALDVAVLTNLSRDHLDYHGSMADYGAAKLRILELVAPQRGRGKAAGVVAYNAADPAFASLVQSGVRAVGFVADPGAEGAAAAAAAVVLQRAEITPEVTRLVVRIGRQTVEMTSPLVGRFNVENTVAALTAGWALGFDPDACAAALAAAAPIPGRLERFALPAGALAVVDYAHTPGALAALLEVCRELAGRRLLVVFGCGGDRDRGKRPAMGTEAAARADRVWVTSDNPRHEDPAAIAAAIVAGIAATRRGAPHAVILDRRAAIRAALSAAAAGDVVVIAGKGHEDYQIVGEERRHLDDREIVREWIAEREVARG